METKQHIKEITLSVELINAVLTYLNTKPYNEVKDLIHGIIGSVPQEKTK